MAGAAAVSTTGEALTAAWKVAGSRKLSQQTALNKAIAAAGSIDLVVSAGRGPGRRRNDRRIGDGGRRRLEEESEENGHRISG